MLESVLPVWAVPSCENRHVLSLTYGALMRVTGLDQMLPAPSGVHWMLGGAAAVYQCEGTIEADKNLAMCMASGYAGGILGGLIMSGM